MAKTHFCQRLKKEDTEAWRLCKIMADEMGIPLSKIDRGVRHTDYRDDKPKFVLDRKTGGNGRPEAPEVYEKAIEILEREESSFALNRTPRKMSGLVAERVPGFRVFWLFNDFNPRTTEDDAALQSYASGVVEAAGPLELKSEDGSASRFTSWILDPKQFGASLKRTPVDPIPMAEFYYGGRAGDCVNLSLASYSAGLFLGASPSFIDSPPIERPMSGDEVEAKPEVIEWHIYTEWKDADSESKIFVDPANSKASRDTGVNLSRASAHAIFAAEHAMRLARRAVFGREFDPNALLDDAGVWFKRAIRADPKNPFIQSSYAEFCERWLRDKKCARRAWEEAVELKPNFEAARERLEALDAQ